MQTIIKPKDFLTMTDKELSNLLSNLTDQILDKLNFFSSVERQERDLNKAL